jgi:hypothetical protein
MLIIYRTNAGFEGQIEDVQENGYGPIFDALVQQAQAQNLPFDLAYIELDVTTIPAAALTDLWVNRSQYSVDPSGPTLLCNGQGVYSAAASQPVVVGRPVRVITPDITRAGGATVSWAGAAPIPWN